MISSIAVLDPASARALAVIRSPAAPASAQAPASSAFRRDTPILVMSILLFQVLGLVAHGAVLSVEKITAPASSARTFQVGSTDPASTDRLVCQNIDPVLQDSFSPSCS